MSDKKTQSKAARLALRDPDLRDALACALASAGFALAQEHADVLVLDAGEHQASATGAATLAPCALQAIADFAAQAASVQRSIILVAGTAGPAREALNGGVRALARSLAPSLRVNALAPLHAGDDMDSEQAGIVAVYLASAGAVTGQVIEIAARKSAS